MGDAFWPTALPGIWKNVRANLKQEADEEEEEEGEEDEEDEDDEEDDDEDDEDAPAQAWQGVPKRARCS